jgi:hypothetical protein
MLHVYEVIFEVTFEVTFEEVTLQMRKKHNKKLIGFFFWVFFEKNSH